MVVAGGKDTKRYTIAIEGIEHVSQLVRHFTEIEYKTFQNGYSVLGGDLEARITQSTHT